MRDADLQGARALVLGLGRFSGGVETVRFLRLRGADVEVSDTATRESLGTSAAEAEALGATLRLGPQTEARLVPAPDLVVANPAIPFDHPVLRAARAEGIPLTTEMNLFLERVEAPVVGITGTKGKSTTSTLIAGILEAAGHHVHLGGNVGRALLGRIDEIRDTDVVVLELSSFQLHWAHEVRRAPNVTLITNLFGDHLDRHGTWEAYAEAKRATLDHQIPSDVAVLPTDDPWVTKAGYATAGPARRIRYGPGGDLDLEAGAIRSRDGGVRIPLDAFPLWGDHNRQNALAAAAAALQVAGVGPDAVRLGLERAEPLAHRLAPVAEVDGVLYVDDSNATNPTSTLKALEACPRPAVVLVGGKSKGLDDRILIEGLLRHAKAVVGIGTTGPDIVRRLEGRLPTALAEDLPEAVRIAARFAAPGDAVLLSPAFASFDEYVSFVERGRRFQAAVADLSTGRHV